jgi:hypothetical protein
MSCIPMCFQGIRLPWMRLTWGDYWILKNSDIILQ